MDLEIAISKVLKKHRHLNGFSQEELANLSSLDRTYISFIERGIRKPTLHSLFKICNSLNIKVSEFIQEVEAEIENNTTHISDR